MPRKDRYQSINRNLADRLAINQLAVVSRPVAMVCYLSMA